MFLKGQRLTGAAPQATLPFEAGPGFVPRGEERLGHWGCGPRDGCRSIEASGQRREGREPGRGDRRRTLGPGRGGAWGVPSRAARAPSPARGSAGSGGRGRGVQQRPIGGDCEAGAPRRKAGGREGGRDGGRETRGVKVGKEVRAVLGPRGRGSPARSSWAAARVERSRGRRGGRRRGERVWGAAAERVAAAGARGALCVRARPLEEEDGPEGKVGVTRAAPAGSAGCPAVSPTERRPGRPGGARPGRRRRRRGARPLTAGGRRGAGAGRPGARAGARGSPAEGWAAPPASTSRRAA